MEGDKHLAKNLGIASIHASRLEAEIEKVTEWLDMANARPPRHQYRAVLEKIVWCKNTINLLNFQN
ncbi:hypothetical protein NBRC116592_03710 [Colwellia sp. KU-HH00111]|uniref:hypothetical protein n=1 Tax=Colwellia sp. KU-HH00111 TaxID=3127652 RepID=UPI0031041B3E